MAASAPGNTAQSDPDPLLGPDSFIAANGQGLAAASSAAAMVSPEKGKRKAPEGDMDWLPTGWTFEDRVRSSGATAGSIDRVSLFVFCFLFSILSLRVLLLFFGY